ncbi:MAG: glycosyltransferase [Leptolyngbya sp. SIO4C1]|nr:glycosyltransferase [Leptolyngbya sp. SIO4C1]
MLLSKNESFIIIPVHNRKTVTLRCLNHLAAINDLNNFQVLVVDDSSNDDTARAIRAQYPQVHLVIGSGDLWWTGAIKLGMEYAYAQCVIV